MEPNLFKYIWRHSRRDQLAILGMVAVSLPFYYVSLDLPKKIVNQGILGGGFEGPGSTQTFLTIDLPFSQEIFGHSIRLFDGFAMEQPGYLLALSFSFFGFVLITGGFKFVINTSKGRLGERMLRRLRYELADRILRFPVLHLRRMKQAETATMIKDEVEPLGGFIGDAFVQPAFLGGLALTALAFIMMQSVWLGLVAGAIVGAQAIIIPKLRVPILRLNRQRQLTARQLAGRIGELVDGGAEVQANDASNLERADMAARLGRIFDIRYEVFQRKFAVKFLNNLLAQLTPFIFYAGGGMLAIFGHLDVGALVAVIAAYKDLPSPIKELIDWDQQRNDVQIKYEQVIEQFHADDIMDPGRQDPSNDSGPPLDGQIVASAVTLEDENGNVLLHGVSFSAEANERIAIVGTGNSGKDYIGLLLASLVSPSGGSVRIGDRDLHALPQAVTGRRLGYIGQDAYLFPVSIRDNLLYGLKHRPLQEPTREDKEAAQWEAWLSEARRAGNPLFALDADWIDYAAAGATGPDDIDHRIIEIVTLVDLADDIYRYGLTGAIDPETQPEVAASLLEARAALPERLAQRKAEQMVVRFDPEAYNPNATLAENLLFGTSRDPAYAPRALAQNRLVLDALEEAGLTEEIVAMGASIARTMVEIFADLPPGHPFFDQFSFIDADDLPDFKAIIVRVDKSGPSALSDGERRALLRLPFDYIETRHRLGLVDDDKEAKIIAARGRIAERLAAEDPEAVAFYRPDEYNPAASLQDNILFGRLAYGQARAVETVGAAMTEVLDSLGLRETVMICGLAYEVGVGGKRLSAAQRQKIGLARALLKRPDILVVNDALAVMDATTQARLLESVLEYCKGRGVVWTLQRPAAAEHFDRVLVMSDGRIVEQGRYEELNKPGSALNGMIAAE